MKVGRGRLNLSRIEWSKLHIARMSYRWRCYKAGLMPSDISPTTHTFPSGLVHPLNHDRHRSANRVTNR